MEAIKIIFGLWIIVTCVIVFGLVIGNIIYKMWVDDIVNTKELVYRDKA